MVKYTAIAEHIKDPMGHRLSVKQLLALETDGNGCDINNLNALITQLNIMETKGNNHDKAESNRCNNSLKLFDLTLQALNNDLDAKDNSDVLQVFSKYIETTTVLHDKIDDIRRQINKLTQLVDDYFSRRYICINRKWTAIGKTKVGGVQLTEDEDIHKAFKTEVEQLPRKKLKPTVKQLQQEVLQQFEDSSDDELTKEFKHKATQAAKDYASKPLPIRLASLQTEEAMVKDLKANGWALVGDKYGVTGKVKRTDTEETTPRGLDEQASYADNTIKQAEKIEKLVDLMDQHGTSIDACCWNSTEFCGQGFLLGEAGACANPQCEAEELDILHCACECACDENLELGTVTQKMVEEARLLYKNL